MCNRGGDPVTECCEFTQRRRERMAGRMAGGGLGPVWPEVAHDHARQDGRTRATLAVGLVHIGPTSEHLRCCCYWCEREYGVVGSGTAAGAGTAEAQPG